MTGLTGFSATLSRILLTLNFQVLMKANPSLGQKEAETVRDTLPHLEANGSVDTAWVCGHETGPRCLVFEFLEIGRHVNLCRLNL